MQNYGLFRSMYSRISFYLRLMQANEENPLEGQSETLAQAMVESIRYQAVIHADAFLENNYIGDYVWKHDIRKETP